MENNSIILQIIIRFVPSIYKTWSYKAITPILTYKKNEVYTVTSYILKETVLGDRGICGEICLYPTHGNLNLFLISIIKCEC